MVVMVNRGTASAAEILAGALQDHDRAWILGESTFGKGLVQAPFPLMGNSTLLLTIAKYYTPSGRLIQRDYSHSSFYEYYSRNEGHVNLKDAKKTDGGRTVFGGDGISPDEMFAAPKYTRLEAELLGRLAFFYYSPQYFVRHDGKMDKSWMPDTGIMDEFREFAVKRGVKFLPGEYEHDKSWIQENLREWIFTTAFSKEDATRVALEVDPEVLKAIDSLPQSKALVEKAKSMVARQARGRSAAIER
jgi:carboxyl-terminal processing protease